MDQLRAGGHQLHRDAGIAARTIFGMASWVVWWLGAGSSVDPAAVASTVTDMAVASVLAPSARAAAGDERVLDAITALRGELSDLQARLRGPGSASGGLSTAHQVDE